MKIRFDFVTNSSSSSFVVQIGIKTISGEEISYEAFAPDDGGGCDYGDLEVDRRVLEKASTSTSVEELKQLLEAAVTYSDYDDEYNFDPKDFQLYSKLTAKSYTKDDYEETASGMGRKKDDIDDGRSVPYSKGIVIFDKTIKKKVKSLDDIKSVFIKEIHTASGENIDGGDFAGLTGDGSVAESVKRKELDLKTDEITEEKSCGWSW